MVATGLEGRTALVTGGSRGIGRAICLALASEGVNVAVNYLDNDAAAQETCLQAAALNVQAKAFKADVTDPPQVAAMIEVVETDLGPVELLVANAGNSIPEDPSEISFEVWRKLMAVNADGTFLTVAGLVPRMVERGDGRIVCISSVAALRPRPHLIAYSAAKAAVIAFVRSAAAAYAPKVRINCVAPGLIDTKLAGTLSPEVQQAMIAATPAGRIGRPEEIADAVVFLLSDRSSYLTGETIAVSGGRVTLP